MRATIALAAALGVAASSLASADAPDSQPVKLGLSWHVSLDAQGKVLATEALDARGEKMPQIRTALESQIRNWRFVPGTVDGQPAPTETTLHLTIAVSLQGDNALGIRIDDARTGGQVAQYTVPHFPRSAIQSRSAGLVVVHARYDGAGKVTQVSLDDATPKTAHDVQQAALDAVKHWVFTPERVAGHGVGGEAISPICFVSVRLAAGQAPPTAAPPPACEWMPPSQRAPIAQGQVLAVHPAATLATEVVGRTL